MDVLTNGGCETFMKADVGIHMYLYNGTRLSRVQIMFEKKRVDQRPRENSDF
jgi:hypothetical protein